MLKRLQVIQQQQICGDQLPRLLCGTSYIHDDVFSQAPLRNFESVDNFLFKSIMDNSCCSKKEECGTVTETAANVNKVSVATIVEAALDSLQNFCLPETKAVTSNSRFFHSIVYQDAAVPSLSNCTASDCVFNPVAVTDGLSLSASVGRESDSDNSAVFGTSVPRTVNSSYILPASNDLVSSPRVSVNHCSVITSKLVQPPSRNETLSTVNNSRLLRRQRNVVSVDRRRRLPAGTTCFSCSSSEPIINPALCAAVSKATALENWLPVASNCGSDSNVLSCHSVLAGSSEMHVPHVTMETLKASSSVTKMSSVVSLGFHPITSTHGTASYSSPFTSVSECTSTVTSCVSQPFLLPSSEVRVNELRLQTAGLASSVACSSASFMVSQCRSIAADSVTQSYLWPASQRLDRKLRSRSALCSRSDKANISDFVPLFDAVSPPCSSFFSAASTVSVMASCRPARISSQAYICTVPTAGASDQMYSCPTSSKGICNPVHKCAIPAVGISDQVPTCTVPVTGISNEICTDTVSASSAVCDGVHMYRYAVPAVEFFSDAYVHTVPTFRVSNPVQLCGTPSAEFSSPVHAGISMQVCSCTAPACGISSTVVFDRVPTCTVPSVGISSQVRTCVCSAAARISDKVRSSAIPSVGVNNPVLQCNVPTTEIIKSSLFESGNVVRNEDTVVSSQVPSSASAPRTRRVLPPATGCSRKQTPVLLSACVPSSVSVCSPVLPAFQVTVKPLHLFTSAPSVTHSQSISHTLAVSIGDRHFLDSLMSLKVPHPALSSVPKRAQILPLSLHHSPLAGGHVRGTSFNRNPVTASSRVKVSSTPLPVVSNVPVFPRMHDPPAGSVDSFTALTTCRTNVTRPTFMLFSPQHQPLLEKIALRLATKGSSVAVTREPTNIRHVASFVGASELVAAIGSSPEDFRHQGDRESQCRSRKAVSSLTDDRVQGSFVKRTSSPTSYPLINNSGIPHRGVRELLNSTDNIVGDRAAESVVMVKASNHHYGNTENRSHCSLTASTPSGKAVEPVVMVTASVTDYCHHDSRVMSCVADNTAIDDWKKSLDITEPSMDNYCLSNREASGYAEMMLATSVWRKPKRVKLCSKVTTTILHKHF